MGKTPRVGIDAAGDIPVPQIVPSTRSLSFFNGNTFAEIGRALANALFSDLPLPRRKETSSAVAHFITGVLDQEMMVAAVQSLGKVASFAVGDPVKTLRGTTHGVIVRLLDDGRVA